MSKKSGCGSCPLKAVENPPPEPEARNFWNTCPRQLDEFSDGPCSLGKPIKNKKGRILKEPECPWWIDSEEDNYCFWQWTQRNSEPTGKMDVLMQNEIAQLFGCSSTKIHFIVKDAEQKLREGKNQEMLADFANELSGEADEHSLHIGSAGLPEASDPEDGDDI